MIEIATELRKTVNNVLPLLDAIRPDDAADKPAPGKWSKKEILGHLIDSACNNQQKFVRAMEQKHSRFAGYRQDHWVESQKYRAAGLRNLVTFWYAYNLHISHIIENVDPALLSNTISIEDAGTFTLKFIMRDYAEHLKHHLNQILPGANLIANFQNIYNT